MSNPFNWTGPEFLKLYALLLAVATTAAFVVRQLVRRSAASNAPLGPYALASLAGGPQRVALLATASLIDRGCATLTNRQIRLTPSASAENDGLLRRMMAAAPPTFSPLSVRRMIAGDVDLIHQTLQSQELVLRKDGIWLSRLVTLLAIGGVLAVGITKISVGILRNKPVEILVFACLGTIVLAFVLFRGLFRTSAGDALLRQMQFKRPEPWKNGPTDPTLVALWGMTALQGHMAYADLRGTLGPMASNGWTGSTGSSCSSSSSSCGSSCGGGCGGCGGD